MPSPQKLIAYFVGVIAVVAALGALFRERIWEAVVVIVAGLLFANGLIEGELSIGRGAASKTFRRDKSPVGFWCLAVIWLAITVVLITSLFFDAPQSA